MNARRTALATAVLALGAGVASTPAAAATLRGFHTPGNGVRCELLHGDDGSFFARCDSAKPWPHLPARPVPCIGDFGFSVHMGARGRAQLGCVSDAVAGGAVLRRGKTIRLGHTFTCRYGSAGVRCTNRVGHGWVVSTRAFRLL